MLTPSKSFTIAILMTLVSCTLQAQNTPTPRGSIVGNAGKTIVLSPVGGYLDVDTRTKGKKGLQKYYNAHLTSGINLPTSINATLQKSTENILDTMKLELNATEVLAMVMDSKTGEMLAMATSNRYDPMHITQADIPNLNPKFTEYPFEPGSVMIPFIVAMNLNAHLSVRDKEKELFNTDFEKLQIGDNLWIKDETKQKALTMTDVLVYSSNIGAVQIAWQLSGSMFHDALSRYGFGHKSGIDLARDLKGMIKSEVLLEDKKHRANNAYGYGLMVTPIQLLKAYSMFANDGWMVTPHIATAEKYESKEVLYKGNARKVKQMLIEVVKRGTGKHAQTEGLTIGGKTGTAHIAKNGKYTQNYHSSFFGFAEDKLGNSYTIGVLVIDPKAEGKYFASQSAVPVFKKVVDVMVDEKLLIPELLKQSKEVSRGDFTIYTNERVVNPLIGAKVVKPFGVYVDPEYDIKVFNESVTLQSSPNIKKVFNVMDGRVVYSALNKILGNTVVMAHKDKLHIVYAGLSEISSEIRVGEELRRAHVLGLVDETLVFQVTHDSKFIDPMKLIMSGEEEKRKYIQECDLNKDRKVFYKDEDIQDGVVSRQTALHEMQCIKERLPNIMKKNEVLQWIIKKGYFEKYIENSIISPNSSVFEEFVCLYAKEKWNMNENHPEYESFMEDCGDIE